MDRDSTPTDDNDYDRAQVGGSGRDPDPDPAAAREHIAGYLKALGLDPDDQHLAETPERVARSRLNELFTGLGEDPREHLQTTFDPPADDSGLVVVDNISVQSMCAHHLLPFTGAAHIGYVPNGSVVGLSKLARVTNGYARRPQVQERLTNQIADAVYEELNAVAAIVVIEAEHECMTLRGVDEPNATTRTSALRGRARTNTALREEFFALADTEASSS